ncbi:heme-binding protein [Cellulosimicrobium cellulans]|uniref:GlcG/HbpS family heme-binding protein n=1 Tax=Cellulosimicrobium cellulans TaxID=1710 RepID=UPI003826E3BA
MTDITLNQALAVLDAARAKAEETGVPSTISVLDSGARVVATVRQDGAPLISVDSSLAKARTAVFFKSPTEALVPAVQPGAPLYTLGDATSEQLTFLAGGRPIVDAQGNVIGAVGSGGGTPDQDDVIAQAAAGALSL